MKKIRRRLTQMSADLNERARINSSDQRLSALIGGKGFCFSPCLGVSVVNS
jgi:hypothetical protein